jgi:hypothetical protein
MTDLPALAETVTLSQAQALIRCLAADQSLLLLSPPGVGKSASVAQIAGQAGLECRSLLGTQIAPEDVSGIPRIVGERSVFCPPRVLLPERPEPFCLFLDELPAAAPDIQKAFYSLLLERRLGEHRLPPGTWVVAAGNRAEDRALVRTVSSALINRVIVLHVRVDVREWLIWAQANGVRAEILAFVTFLPEALMRAVPREPVPFSTPPAAPRSKCCSPAPRPMPRRSRPTACAACSTRWSSGSPDAEPTAESNRAMRSRRSPRSGTPTGRRGNWRCNAGSTPTRRGNAVLPGRRDGARTEARWCGRDAGARAGCCTWCSIPAVR